ncbi:hypothetical protein PC113_g17728 [Phytophthora cactorum]|uniref:Uncharacterized protein n=1 Tax=Phytophthora cactorum TaxID=29920 RepID=A0A8T0YAK3_9STRA|nr:hypothetical protein PC113_g17728 [Phytophthora cactorum]
MSTPSGLQGVASSSSDSPSKFGQPGAKLSGAARPTLTTTGGMGAVQSLVQRVTTESSRGRGGGHSNLSSARGRSQSLRRVSSSTNTLSGSTAGFSGNTPGAHATAPTGTSTLLKQQASGPSGASGQATPDQVWLYAFYWLQSTLNHPPVGTGAGPATLNVASGTLVGISGPPMRQPSLGAAIPSLEVHKVIGQQSQSVPAGSTHAATPAAGTPQVRTNIPAYQSCSIGQQVNSPSAGFNHFFAPPGWSPGTTTTPSIPVPGPTVTPSWTTTTPVVNAIPVSWSGQVPTSGSFQPGSQWAAPSTLSQGMPNTLLACNSSIPMPTIGGGHPPFRGPGNRGGPGNPGVPGGPGGHCGPGGFVPPGGPPSFGGTPAWGAGGSSGGYYPSHGYGNAPAASFGMASHIKNALTARYGLPLLVRAEKTPPVAAAGWERPAGLDPIVKDPDGLDDFDRACTEVENGGSPENKPSEVEVEAKSEPGVVEDGVPPYARLFTPEELDDLENGEDSGLAMSIPQVQILPSILKLAGILCYYIIGSIDVKTNFSPVQSAAV